jgi:hypothetical protein
MTRLAIFTLLATPVSAALAQHHAADSAMVMDAADAAMTGPMAQDPHMRLTPMRAAAPGDSERAALVVAAMRRSLERYRDVAVAQRDGFRQFLPRVQRQRVYHFTNWLNGLGARRRFDPARPTSLLYRKDSTGAFVLVGAMYTDAADTPLDELDRRIPLSIAHWHQHVNWCLPPRGAPERWTETREGRPVFGPRSPVATRAACDAAGGRFVPRLFGWMVHVNAFAGDLPAAVWGDADHAH